MKGCSVAEVIYELKLQKQYKLIYKLLSVEIGAFIFEFEMSGLEAPGGYLASEDNIGLNEATDSFKADSSRSKKDSDEEMLEQSTILTFWK